MLLTRRENNDDDKVLPAFCNFWSMIVGTGAPRGVSKAMESN